MTAGAPVEGWEETVRTLIAATHVAGAAAPTVRPEHVGRIEAAVRRCTERQRAPRVRELAAPVVGVARVGRRETDARPARARSQRTRPGAGHPRPPSSPGLPGPAWDRPHERSKGRTPQQAAALTAEALAALRATAHRPRSGPGGRTITAEQASRRSDVAVATTRAALVGDGGARRRSAAAGRLVTVIRDALLRLAGAAALTWSDVEDSADAHVAEARTAISRLCL